MNNVLLKLVTESRLLTILYDNLSDTIKASSLYEELSDYLQDYLTENKISAGNAIDTYSKYITAYNQHCKTFIKTNSYPIQNGDYAFTLSREEYDVILLLSTLFSAHRFRIMQLVVEQSKPEQNGLYIGAGSGVEIALTQHNYKEIFAYDLSVNKYLFGKFKDIQLKEELYKGQKINYFNSVYLIELLEHIEDPYGLIKICHGSLTPRGKIFLTTATNIPQFDHLYNFPEDHHSFEEMTDEMGFSVIFSERIPHHYLSINLNALNYFYTLEKR